jgi:hypothetical protein
MKTTTIYRAARMAAFTLVAWLSPLLAEGQSYFQKVYYDSPYDQEGQDVVQMPDGGYLICGYTTNATLNDMDVLVIKTDAAGNQVWKQTYGGSKPDYPHHMLATSDGNYLLVGHSQSYSGGDYDVLLLKIDPNGNTIWLKTYGGWGNDKGSDIIATSDGNYMIIGQTDSWSQDLNFYMIKIDGGGNVIWSKNLGGSGNDFGSSIQQTPDGGYMLLGTTYSFGVGGDALQIKTDAGGNQQWQNTFGGGSYDEGMYVVVNSDGSAVMAIRDSSLAGKDIDTRVIKTDAGGAVQWNKVYGGTKKDTPKMIQHTMDGGYVMAAITRSYGLISPDMWIVKLDANGDTTWTRRYGGSQHEHCYVVRELSDGSYIAIGKTESYSPDFEVIFLRVNSSGTMTTGEELASADKTFRMYPNPAADRIVLDLRSTKASRVTLTDIAGRELYAGDVVGREELSINLAGKSEGIYFVTVDTEAGRVTRKLIHH